MLLSQSTKKAINRTLDDIRAALNGIGKKVNGILLVLLKFVGFYLAIHTVTGTMDGLYTAEGFLTKTVIRLGLAVVCTILPARFGTLLVLGLLCYFMVKVSLFGGIVASLLVLLIFLITVCFTPEFAYLLLLVPFFAQKGWFMIVPLFVGIYATPMAVLGLLFGSIMWAALGILPQLLSYGATVLDGGSLGDLLEFLPTMVVKTGLEVASAFVANKALIFYGVLIAAVAIIAWIVGKLRIKYAPYWAIAIAGIVGIVGLILLKVLFGFPDTIAGYIFGTICAMAFAALLRLLDVPLDYRFVRNLTFQDDEFYYQVRLTPIGKNYQNSTKALLAKKKKKKQNAENKPETTAVSDETRILTAPVTEAGSENANGDTIVMTDEEKAAIRAEEKSAKKTKAAKEEARKADEAVEAEAEKAEKAARAEQEKAEKAEKAAKEKAEKAEKAARAEQEKAEKAEKAAKEKAEKAEKAAQEKAEKASKKAKEEAENTEKTAKEKLDDLAKESQEEAEKKNKASEFWEEVKKAAKRTAAKITGKKPAKKTKDAPKEEKASEAEVDEVLKDF